MITNYLQHCLNLGLSYNTVRTRVTAINDSHPRYGVKKSLSKEPSIQRFKRGAFITHAPVRDKVPAWDLPIVLQALKFPPFEPIADIGLDVLTMKTVFLLAICSAKRVGELQSLDCRPAFCAVSDAGVVLRTGPRFVPKVPSLSNLEQALEFKPFGKNVANPTGTPRAICVCRALQVYLAKTKQIRKTDQLFVTFKQGDQGRPVRTPTLATWLKNTISMAYAAAGKELTTKGFKAHGIRGQSCSWADLKCASVMDICRQACWQSPNVFVKHYKLDLPASVSQRHGQLVLQATDE
jgi:integrase